MEQLNFLQQFVDQIVPRGAFRNSAEVFQVNTALAILRERLEKCPAEDKQVPKQDPMAVEPESNVSDNPRKQDKK